MSKPPHRQGNYHTESRRIRRAAEADPSTQCWRCGLTLQEHAPHANGKPPQWQAGHLVDGQAGGPMLPEASTCNSSDGGKRGSRIRSAAQAQKRTDLTW